MLSTISYGVTHVKRNISFHNGPTFIYFVYISFIKHTYIFRIYTMIIRIKIQVIVLIFYKVSELTFISLSRQLILTSSFTSLRTFLYTYFSIRGKRGVEPS